jgi:DNA-binding transcriptional regulator YiaG
MPNIASLLKTEISRVARKEVRAEIEPLRKASGQYRSSIAALKREVTALQRQLTSLQKKGGRQAAAVKEVGEETGINLRFRAGGFASLRKKLDLSAADMGKLLGVSGQSVYAWETGKTRPRASQLQAIAAVRKLGKREVLARLEAQ